MSESSETRAVARSAGTVGAATMLSRVLGLVREQVMAGFFGAGFATDAFNVAFRIPNLLRDLFAEGAMSAAFVPTFTEYHEKRGPEAAWRLGAQVFAALAIVLAALVLVAWLAAPWIVPVFAPGFGAVPGKLELTVDLTRIMLPFLPAVALAAACMGMLHARGRFAVPALAPSMLNLGMIVVGVGLIPVMRGAGHPPIVAMAIGVLAGGIAQLLFQLPALRALGFRLRVAGPLFSEGVRRVGTLMLPATIGLAATQINLMVTTIIASLLEEGSVSWLWYAYRLMQLPIGVFGVALATVSLPALSRAAVAEDLAGLKRTLNATLRLVFLLTLPAALWLAVASTPLVALLYEHGRFTTFDTGRTALALVMYCIGLPAFAAVGVVARAFFALGDTRTPVIVSFFSVALNLALNLVLMGPMGHAGMALATALTSVFSLLQLLHHLRRRIGPFALRATLGVALRIAAAAGAGALVTGAALAAAGDAWHGRLLGEALVVSAALLLMAGSTYAALRALKVQELAVLEDLARGLLRRLGGGRGGDGA
jgi:putative peptidoglycan lipid II flippase